MDELIKTEALNMLYDLESNKLTVHLSEPIDGTGRRLRLKESSNPEWYSMLFKTYSNMVKGKGSRSQLRRCRVIEVLRNISSGVVRRYPLYDIILGEINDRLTQGYYVESEGVYVPPQIRN